MRQFTAEFLLLLACVSPVVAQTVESKEIVQPVSVPFVGCASDGQIGLQPAPFGTTKLVMVTPREAEQLAYYSAGGAGVLAPRGWHCFGLDGSSGSGLHVSTASFDGRQLMSDDWAGFSGPAVEGQWRCGGTSGRFTVAEFIASVFPTRIGFTLDLMRWFGMKPSDFHFGPYPDDQLIYRAPTALRYTTPAGKEGLGTKSWLKASDRPIQGAALLRGEFPDLLHLAVRLPESQAGLTPAIVRQFEIDASQNVH